MYSLSIKSHRGFYDAYIMDGLPGLTEKDKFVIIDKEVNNLYFKAKGDHIYEIKTTEETKTLEGCENLANWLISRGFQRGDTINAIGGGVIQDLVSFTASMLYRGVDWVYCPTTMLSQCDSCIGSKTSINHNGIKNVLGGFYPPSHIVIFTELLKSLPDSEIKCGIGEMLHYFLLNHRYDISEEMVNDESIRDNIQKYLFESLTIKKKMIELDEFDKGERNLFNYGHTFGHAIETVSGYTVNHGQAVTLGMYIANKISFNRKLISKEKFKRVQNILKQNLPDYKIKDIDSYIQALKKDKKNTSDMLTCILLTEEYGEKTEITYEEVTEVVLNMYKNVDRHVASPFDFML